MRSVAQRAGAAVLAAAEIHGLRLTRLVFDRREYAALVTAVTERLSGAFAAGAPPVTLAGFHFDGIRGFLGDN